jgi:hypothetical protein
MFGIRLGEFGKGFVGGLAESANEALKTDIKNINTRIDDLAKIKFDRALKDQDERKKEVTEAEEILREAGAVFGDDPYAADYAAALLKETGSIDAFRQEIAKLRTAKDNNVPLAQFIRRASVDSPTGTFRDYANAYVNSRRTMPDLTTPVDTTSTGDLVGSILGKDIDIGGRVDKRVSEQMSAAGVTPVTDAGAFTAPSLSYDREGLSMYQMSPAERVTYLRQELSRTQNTDARNDELRGMLSDNLQAAIDRGDLETQLSGLKTQLSYATTDGDRERLQGEVLAVERQIETNDATTDKDKKVVALKHAEEDSDGSAEALANIVKLRDEIEDMTSPLTVSKALNREQRDLEAAIAAGETIPDYQTRLDSIKAKRDKLAEVNGTNILDFSDLKAAENTIAGSIANLLRQNPLTAEIKTEQTLDGTTFPVYPPGLKEDRKKEITAAFVNARNNAFNSHRTALEASGSTKSIMALDYVQAMYENQFGEIPPPSADTKRETPPVSEPLVIGDTTVAADTIASFAADADTDVTSARQRITDMITMYPPTDIEAAKNITSSGPDKSQERKLAIIDAMEGTGIYSAEWIAAAREAAGKPTPPPPVETDIDKAAQALQILDPSFMTGDRDYINAISKRLKISKDEAIKLLPEAKKAYAELKRGAVPQENKRPDQLLADIRGAKTPEAYEAAVAAYADNQGRTVDDVKEQYPSKVATKAKGGLMARGA